MFTADDADINPIFSASSAAKRVALWWFFVIVDGVLLAIFRSETRHVVVITLPLRRDF